MKIVPTVTSVLAGSIATVELQEYDPEATIVVTSGNDNVATCTYADGIITVVGVGAGTAVLTAQDGSTTALCTVTVTAPSQFVDITADGSGTGNDASVFGRQYIINNNLKRVNDIVGVMNQTLNTVRTLSITNQATNTAALAAIAANIILTISMLNDMSSAAVSNGKNTVEM